MGELSASIAHEINQPLTAIITNADTCLHWLSGPADDFEKARAAAIRMKSDAQRASDVLGRIRALLVGKRPERIHVAVNDVIRDVLSLVGGELQSRDVCLMTQLTETSARIIADPIQLQQVVLNLIMNAVEAMVAVTDRRRTLIISSDWISADKVMVSTEDNGIGLDPAFVNCVFDPFFTTKASGMGMGLSICRSIIEAHGGELRASRAAPFGAKFQFTLPLDPDLTS